MSSPSLRPGENRVERVFDPGHRSRRDGAKTPVARARRRSLAFDRIEELFAAGQCCVLDGGTGTELADSTSTDFDERLWGINALVNAPREVLEVHRRYAETGCDVITTDTWGLAGALHDEGMTAFAGGRSVHWMDLARHGIRLARRAAADVGRADELAVAFSLSGAVDTPQGQETLELLARVFDDHPPDLILLETLSVVWDSLPETVEALLEIGFPVWMSFRRCPQGLCGVYGQHWGGPEGDVFGRAAHRFEDIGVGALLVNCIPPDHVAGMVPWLRDFTDLPLGVYPNLGYFTDSGWRFETDVGSAEYAKMALQWRAEGAQLVGGCCGVGPRHIAAARDILEGTPVGRQRAQPAPEEDFPLCSVPARPGWVDEGGRRLFPLDFPDIPCDPGVFAPTQGSLLVWRYLFREGIGAGKRCLDVGCGGGLQTVQLALNGATHVHALDLDKNAVANTLTNAFRNGVADRVSGAAVDLYPWVPKERYDVVVASLYQTPVDPFEQVATHRPLDYWGRNLIDHLIARLPEALAEDGVAYVMQLSIIGMHRTIELLAELGFRSRVVDFSFFEFHDLFAEKKEQILRVEEFSDAYHLTLGATDVIVAYLVEVTRAQPEKGAV